MNAVGLVTELTIQLPFGGFVPVIPVTAISLPTANPCGTAVTTAIALPVPGVNVAEPAAPILAPLKI